MTVAPFLQVNDLEKVFRIKTGSGLFSTTYGSLRAVDKVSFKLGRGETLGVVGESGCGKTTMAMMLLGLEDPSGGDIVYDGESLQDQGRAERKSFRNKVQAVLQDPWSSMSPKMRIREFLAEPMIARGELKHAERQEVIARVLNLVGMRVEHADRFPHEFSGGQRQRLCIARALTVEPELIILDEPVSALDVSVQAQIINLLKSIQARTGVSYIMISHSLATVRYLCSHVAVMYLGQIVEFATAAELFAEPRHPYSKALIEASDPLAPIGGNAILNGEIPSPADPPSGCRFHTRCPKAFAPCSDRQPAIFQFPDAEVRCHLYENGPAAGALNDRPNVTQRDHRKETNDVPCS